VAIQRPARAGGEPSGGEPWLRFWSDTRLRVAAALRPRRGPSRQEEVPAASWREALDHLLEVACGREQHYRFDGEQWQRIRRRSTPSAGALYPFEILVFFPASGQALVYDVAAGRLLPWAGPGFHTEDLPGLGLPPASDRWVEAVVLFLARPWRSMGKYGPRGYLYCHLDVGHAVTNLALYATALGIAPAIHLHFDRQALVRHLDLDRLCREPLVSVVFSRPGEGGPATLSAPPEPGFLLPEPEAEERRAWASLRDLAESEPTVPEDPPAPGIGARARSAPGGVEISLAAPRCLSPTASDLSLLIRKRRSAAGFLPTPLRRLEVSDLLAALRHPGPTTDVATGREPALSLVLLVRRVDGLAGGAYHYDLARHTLRLLASAPPQGFDFGPATMEQEVVRQGAALLLFTAPIRPLLARRGRGAVAELHFEAGHLGQRLYLAAAHLGLGLTCLGGFDEQECARLAPLPEGEEVIYAAVFGHGDPTTEKHDRLAVAWSHGFSR